jgi:hypothetical protein
MEVLKNLPYANKPEIRKRIEELFSREMLGAVLVGKFAGDYAAILTTGLLGTHVGYILGITLTIGLFIYWEKVAQKAQEQKDKLNPAQTKMGDFN